MHHLQNYIPFMLAAGSDAPAFSIVRILEALIIACVTAGITAFGAGYVTQEVMKSELRHLDSAQVQNHNDIKEVRRDLHNHELWELNNATGKAK